MYVIILISVVLLILFYYEYKFGYWKRKDVYYPKPTIPFGNMHPFTRKRICMHTFLKRLYDETKMMKKPYGGFFIGTIPLLLITDLELIKTILIKDYKYFHDRGFHYSKNAPKFFHNLVVLFGKEWKRIRSKLSPAFTINKMKMIFNTVFECAENLDIILDKPRDEPIDIKDVMSRLTLDIIAVSTFGFHSNTLLKQQSNFYHIAHKFERFLFHSRISHLQVFYPSTAFLTLPFNVFNVFNIQIYFKNILRNNIKKREENNIHKNDFLDLFMKLMKNQLIDDDSSRLSKDCLSFNEMAATAFSFYIGGYHTTESSLSFGLLQLSLNQNIQNKLRKNIGDTLEKHQGNITYDSIMEMDYLEQVTCEILRMYPIIPLILRECNADYKIQNSDFIIEKGTKVWTSILGLHMDPEYYPNPTEFNPDRFTQEEITKRKPFTYLPFGEGHRICIGKRFGLLQMKVALVKLIRTYRFTVDPKTIVPDGPMEFEIGNVFLAPKNKIWLNVSKITEEYYNTNM